MKKLFFAVFLYTSICHSQTITVDSSTYSAVDLVSLLFDSSCIEPTNVSFSSNQSVAYFNKNNSSFPIDEGIIIRNGIAQYSEGSYTNTNLSSQINTNTDADLQNISNSSGQNSTITDVAFLQFDFIPVSSDFNFNFIFASNEYGEYQCGFSDVFAFLITDLNTGITTNIAVVPGTTTPISVLNIRNNIYNALCTSVNSNLFDVYNVNNPSASSLNMRGHTVLLNAVATIIPNNPYRLRLVIGDYNDSNFDSAVFLTAGSFSNIIDLGEDTTLCDGSNTTITTSLDDTIYSHTWTFNSVIIPNETSNTLNINQVGTYGVTVIRNGTLCEINDEIVFTELQVTNPTDLFLCDDNSGAYLFDLTENNSTALGVNSGQYQIFYYNSAQNVINNIPIAASDINSYSSAGNETIYIKLFDINSNTFCNAEFTFDLLLTQTLVAGIPDDILLCNTSNNFSINLFSQDSQVLNGLSPSSFTVQYFTTEANAINNVNPISNLFDISIATSPQTVWVSLQTNSNINCYDVTSFEIIVNPLPEVDELDDVLACENYVLPPLTFGNYYDGPNGTGNLLNASDTIDEIGTYYIFSGPDANGCTNQTSFFALFMNQYSIELEHCGEYIIPLTPAGNFYTQAGGPNGSGTIIPPGTIITSDQTIYLYVEIDGVFCKDHVYPLVILPLPAVDSLSSVITCDSYILQPLTNGNYFTDSDGGGTALFAGNVITSTSTIFIYADDGICTNQSSFNITLLSEPNPVVSCGDYILPPLEIGDYYTGVGGQGTIIPPGTTITSSQTIYVYSSTTTAPNCTSTFSLPIIIKPIPLVDELSDVFRCINNPYELPVLNNGNYYTETDAGGTMLTSGDMITASQTIYIYSNLNGCANETFFEVELVPLPLVENFTDVFSCQPFQLPPIANGTYYTEPGGNGNLLPAGTIINTTQIVYIYNEINGVDFCENESVFQVNILGIDVGTFTDINACDSYTLPTLSLGDYFWQTGGIDPISVSDFTFNIPGTYTIYVYAENGLRFSCIDESSFQLTISSSPILPSFQNIEKCESYTLPQLDNSSYTVNYYLGTNGTNIINPSDYVLNQAGVYTIYVFATAFDNINCFDETSFQVTIHPLLDINIDDAIICVDPITNQVLTSAFLNTNLSPNSFTVSWYFNNALVHTGPSYNATQTGIYTIEFDKLIPDIGSNCNYYTTNVEVTQSSFAVAEVEVTDDFENNSVATVNIINGYGIYEYQLNDGNFQSSNQFFNLASGEHIITIRDIYGDCGINTVTFVVLNYPHFFTPNGDGYNDTWNIWDLSQQKNAYIYIFDRYGKYIHQFQTNSTGWDGKLNGKDLPSTDYWFVVKYLGRNNEEAVFKAHFAMKR